MFTEQIHAKYENKKSVKFHLCIKTHVIMPLFIFVSLIYSCTDKAHHEVSKALETHFIHILIESFQKVSSEGLVSSNFMLHKYKLK